MTITPAVTSYKICISVFDEAKADYTTHKLPFRFLLKIFEEYLLGEYQVFTIWT